MPLQNETKFMETCTNVVKLTLNLQKAYRYNQTNIQLRVSWIFVDARNVGQPGKIDHNNNK